MENLFLSDVSVLCGGGAATVRINREEKLNALNSGVLDQLCYVFREIGKARDIRVAVLTGAGGRAFAAGADLAEIAELGNIEALREYYRQFNILYSIMGEIPQPIVARVNGWPWLPIWLSPRTNPLFRSLRSTSALPAAPPCSPGWWGVTGRRGSLCWEGRSRRKRPAGWAL